jgi:hypothetical protein
LTTASTVHVTNRTPRSDNPSSAYGQMHQLMTAGMVHVTAGMVHVTNPVTPGSECNPTICTWDWPYSWPALTGILLGRGLYSCTQLLHAVVHPSRVKPPGVASTP